MLTPASAHRSSHHSRQPHARREQTRRALLTRSSRRRRRDRHRTRYRHVLFVDICICIFNNAGGTYGHGRPSSPESVGRRRDGRDIALPSFCLPILVFFLPPGAKLFAPWFWVFWYSILFFFGLGSQGAVLASTCSLHLTLYSPSRISTCNVFLLGSLRIISMSLCCIGF